VVIGKALQYERGTIVEKLWCVKHKHRRVAPTRGTGVGDTCVAALDHLRGQGSPVQEEDLAHLSPARFEHINPYGKYSFPIDQARSRQGLRSLRAA
jgi:hypothetical protein